MSSHYVYSLPPLRNGPDPNMSERERFTREQLEDLLESTSPPPGVHRLCEELRERVQDIVTARWSDAKLTVPIFGSFQQGLATNDSDLDLCIIDPTPRPGAANYNFFRRVRAKLDPVKRRLINGLPAWFDVQTLAETITAASAQKAPGTAAWKMTFSDVRAIPTAKVPLLTFRAHQRDFEIKLDLVVNNPVGRAKSDLVREYVGMQPEIFPLMYHAIKTWLKYEKHNEPASSKGPRTLSSFAIKLILIHFLQEEGFLPNLQGPLLLSHLKLPRNKVALHLEAGSNPKPITCNVAHFRPSVAVMEGVGPITYEDEGCWTFRYYRHLSEYHRGAPMLGSDWMQKGKKTEAEYAANNSFEPHNRVGLHCVEGGGEHRFFGIEEMFPVFFIFLSGHVYYDAGGLCPEDPENEGTEALARKRAFTINVDALPREGQWQEEWLKAHLILQDPFMPERNLLSNVTDRDVFRRLEKATERAMNVNMHDIDRPNFQPLWTDARPPPRKRAAANVPFPWSTLL